ncbi:hypothetical protein CCH79_00018292 [Gambusia affinis]|uniref:Uncharacterized protein n=1 Tax=Gambusia affinis TaxID=33528 RepID=A0A315UXX9_GAMAF|nr:hypothetical protein CCH79_00018292 [Gambusia affinis]
MVIAVVDLSRVKSQEAALAPLLTRSIASVELTCSTNTTANGTFYKVPDFGKSHCTPQWLDADNNTFAIGDKKNGSLVVASNITTLLTYDCYNIVMYILDCYPQTWRNKKFTCVANCSKSARVTPDNKEGTVNHWVVPTSTSHSKWIVKCQQQDGGEFFFSTLCIPFVRIYCFTFYYDWTTNKSHTSLSMPARNLTNHIHIFNNLQPVTSYCDSQREPQRKWFWCVGGGRNPLNTVALNYWNGLDVRFTSNHKGASSCLSHRGVEELLVWERKATQLIHDDLPTSEWDLLAAQELI